MRITALILGVGLFLGTSSSSSAAPPTPSEGSLPADATGTPLNFDFESGTLRDWTAEGDAFRNQPIRGDAVYRRRQDMRSRHIGSYWIGSFEVAGDSPQGTLTSRSFAVAQPYATFLIAGGSRQDTRVEIVRQDTGKVVFTAHGDDSEELKPVLVDLQSHVDKPIFVRLVDQDSRGWGHINFDDFRFHAEKPNVPARNVASVADVYTHSGLDPEAAARAMTVPEGFRVSLFAAEPDVCQPIAMTLDERGRLWVAEAYSYPIRVAPENARDRILIFEDRDGDGRFDSRKVFADKLNLVSGLAVGFGGVFVGTAPELVFIPDADGDDKADGPARVLLDGWGYQDTHETLNTFIWGPDGWLYGCHGVFTHSRVGKPGTPDAQRTPINAGIWRYHPTRDVFEVFAHGTSNPWGVDFDDRGQAFLTSCVIPHLYHVISGARYERQAGPHFNSHTYNDIKTIADHRHYLGANPHGGNDRSDAAGGGHAHCGAMIYLADAWPAEYRGRIFMNNIHGARINQDTFMPKGSGFVGSHAPDFLRANDRWSQIINLMYGPDGNVFFIDWYDRQQCHLNDINIHDRSNGRIFKVSYGASRAVNVDLRSKTDLELAELQLHANDWYVRQARRLLQERRKIEGVARMKLTEIATSHPDETRRLRAVWALHVVGEIDNPLRAKLLADRFASVRGWAVRLACEEGEPTEPTLRRFAALARDDDSPVVRLELASALQRIGLDKRKPILEALSKHGEDANDPNLPLMLWYAAEPLAADRTTAALDLARESKIPLLQGFTARRVASLGTPEALASLVRVLQNTEDDGTRKRLLAGALQGLAGRRDVAMPEAWPKAFAVLIASQDPEVRSTATALGLVFGDLSARDTFRQVAGDASAELGLRQQAVEALVRARDAQLPPLLRRLLDDRSMRSAALRGLAAFEDAETPRAILAAYRSLRPEERRDALNTLAARLTFARPLMEAVVAGSVPSADLSPDLVRQIKNIQDPTLDAAIARIWGKIGTTSRDRLDRIAKTRASVLKPGRAPDLSLGRAAFAKTCQQCHTLFAEGGKVGPDLTGSNRGDVEYLLSNILDPNALIGKDYLAQVVATADGRILTGIIRAEDQNSITLATANETLTLPKSDIEERKPSETSMMPDDLLNQLSEHEVRSLFSYLASPGQVPLPKGQASAAPAPAPSR